MANMTVNSNVAINATNNQYTGDGEKINSSFTMEIITNQQLPIVKYQLSNISNIKCIDIWIGDCDDLVADDDEYIWYLACMSQTEREQDIMWDIYKEIYNAWDLAFDSFTRVIPQFENDTYTFEIDYSKYGFNKNDLIDIVSLTIVYEDNSTKTFEYSNINL